MVANPSTPRTQGAEVNAKTKETLPELELPTSLTIQIQCHTDWIAAICPELMVSGFGGTIKDALKAIGTSIESQFRAHQAHARAMVNKGEFRPV